MSFDTINGTGTAAAMSDGRPIIAKTGTTDNARSAFFIGAIPQYALTVGIFTDEQSDPNQTLNNLGGNVGGGFGGYWPARIWNTFAEDEWSSLPIEQFPTPQFSGATWNMFGADAVTTPAPAPTASATQPAPQPTRPARPAPTFPVPTVQPTAPVQTCFPGETTCNGGGGGPGNARGALNGAALAAPLFPVSWLWSRRRKRKRR
jgi:membrane peptidoglycan carboxypeptidase